jgi:hypothetical protein
VLTDVSEERIASIFRVEDKKKSASKPAWAGATEQNKFGLCPLYCFSLKD